MLQERIEVKWIRAFETVFGLSAVVPGDAVAIPSESQWRGTNVQLAELALRAMDAWPFHIWLPSRPRDRAVRRWLRRVGVVDDGATVARRGGAARASGAGRGRARGRGRPGRPSG